MEFTIIYYFAEDDPDFEPIVEFLSELRTSQPVLEKLLVSGLRKLRHRAGHGPPLTELVDPVHDIIELRVGRRDIARAFFFFRAGQRIVVTNGYVKKAQRVDIAELERARRYKRDWERRFS